MTVMTPDERRAVEQSRERLAREIAAARALLDGDGDEQAIHAWIARRERALAAHPER